MLYKNTLILLTILSCVSCDKILVLVPFPAPSHWLWIDHFVQELLARGHEVTALTNFKAKIPNANYTEVIIDPPYDIPYYFPIKDIFDMRYDSDYENLLLYWRVGLFTTEYALNNINVKNFIERNDLSFDLIMAEQFFQESFLMFAHKYNAPIVTIGTLGFADYLDHTMGLMTPWSHISHPILDYGDNMTIIQRAYNGFFSLLDVLGRKYYYMPKQNNLAKNYFSQLDGPLPSVQELEKSISVMLINSHRSTIVPRPQMPGMISVAGAHIKKAKPLPKDIKEFMDGATNGVVYFSLGSYLKSSDMPQKIINVFLENFKLLKQRVIWKFEDDTLIDLPENIMIRNWLPQSDILAHKNVVLFITHGGMFGTQEGLYRGVPMLFIPLYGDQHRNAKKCEKSGSSLTLSFNEVKFGTLKSKLSELIKNKKYYNRAKELSQLFRDNPIKPMDEAMFWIEYVIRHKGAKHLKSYAVNLQWYQYLMLDIIFGFIILFYLSYKYVFKKRM